MQRFFTLLAILLLLGISSAFALPNFWYSAVAYNASGQIITASPLASVEITVTDGSNSITQTKTNIPVNGFGIFNVYVDHANLNSISMLASTRITIKVNGVVCVGAPLSSELTNSYHYGEKVDLDSEVNGKLPLANITPSATNGYVLGTSGGNVTWQDWITPKIHMSALSCNDIDLSPNTPVVINTWQNLNEAGGANFNPSTGTYTIPVSGYYSLALHVSLSHAPSANAEMVYAFIWRNGAQLAISYAENTKTNEFPGDMNIYVENYLNAGDAINFGAYQNTTGNMVIRNYATYFSIHLIHK